MTADRIAYSQLTDLVTARYDYPSQSALHAALNGIKTAERAMREEITALRSALTPPRPPSMSATRPTATPVAQAAAGLDRASTARDIHWATAAALLTHDELALLGVTTPPDQHRQPPGDG
jgi:hypothetical protein